MDFELKTLALGTAVDEKCDAMVVLVGEGLHPGKDALSTLISQALAAGDLEAKPGKVLSAYGAQGLGCSRVVLVGAGDGSPKSVRQAVAAAVTVVKTGPAKGLLVVFSAAPRVGAVRAAVLGAAEASYSYTTTKSKPEARKLKRVTIGCANSATAKTEFERAQAVVLGVELAKEWANRPANHATPSMLAHAAKALAKQPKIKCEVLGPSQVEKLGMGSFMAVSRGSDEPLRFIVLRYDGAAKSEAPVVLVGKGITFDTGGISLKPAPEMDEMKFDMSGAASVLGVFRALAELQPALNVVGLIPACENMPDGRAIKPGDVVTSMSGQTIEILNTDAEGRLVLCDALTYAERFKPRAVIDIATLTGACMIALGGVRSGMFSSDEALANALLAAGEGALDPCWRLPLDDEYAEGLKTHFADVANVSGRAGGAITAAKFLQRFAARFPWAHLDIAGTAWKGAAAKGATGRPVGLLVDYLLHEAARPVSPHAKAVGKRAAK
jgi:leucyl aminopeptidase